MSTHARDLVSNAKSAAKSAAKDTSAAASTLLDQSIEKASDSAADVAAFADKSLDDARKRAQALARQARPYVRSAQKQIRRHPVASVAAALAIGVLVTGAIARIARSLEA
jgi:ElaB/YqjD/DUF883 family membrane-anchored ribosome-binding protein